MDSKSKPELSFELPPEITPLPVLQQIIEEKGGAANIQFRQARFRCLSCKVIWPAQIEVSLNTNRLRCPICGSCDSEEVK